MSAKQAWKVRSSGVTHQSIEGEVIAIHMERGTYHSISGAAAIVWELIKDAPHSAADLAGKFANAPENAAERIGDVLKELAGHDLLEEVDSPDGTDSSEPVAWTEPVVESFDDMQDLLLADPIHDVDERGWPNLATADESKN